MSYGARGVLARGTGFARLLSSWGGAGRARGVTTAALAAVITMVALCGCQTTEQRSAELQRLARHQVLAARGLTVARENPAVRVLQSTVVRSREATAVVVALRNTSSHALANAPIEVTVRDAKGAALYRNDAPGLQPSLTRVSLLEPDKETIWVDDQVQASGTPASANARVGEASAVSSVPKTSVVGAHLSSEAGAEATESGSVANGSSVAQANLVVYATARRAGRIVAAGRAVLPEVAAGTSVPFQIYFVGDPSGAKIETSAPATTF